VAYTHAKYLHMPSSIHTESALDELISRPRPILCEFAATLPSPILILGAGGKMGPSLAVMLRRAAEEAGHPLNIIAVSRYSDQSARSWLDERGVRTISCDLLDRARVAELPNAENIIYMAGRKFGTTDHPELTWAMNSVPVVNLMERYPGSRVVALSTGCVYPFVQTDGRGSVESDPLTPIGEYANACVARERLFEYYSIQNQTPVVIIRLNYALDLRYGVLVDIGTKVFANLPVDLSMGYFNAIWQGDANEMIVRSLALAEVPPRALNLTGAEVLSVRTIAERFGELFGVEPRLVGEELPIALLSDATKAIELLGEPPTPVDRVVEWTAAWISDGGRNLGKPTHFEETGGAY
jgi:nucleoside-diphosphate-sugar epimerase